MPSYISHAIMGEELYKEVSILKNDKRYTFMFFNSNYFNNQYIKELLNPIVID